MSAAPQRKRRRVEANGTTIHSYSFYDFCRMTTMSAKAIEMLAYYSVDEKAHGPELCQFFNRSTTYYLLMKKEENARRAAKAGEAVSTTVSTALGVPPLSSSSNLVVISPTALNPPDDEVDAHPDTIYSTDPFSPACSLIIKEEPELVISFYSEHDSPESPIVLDDDEPVGMTVIAMEEVPTASSAETAFQEELVPEEPANTESPKEPEPTTTVIYEEHGTSESPIFIDDDDGCDERELNPTEKTPENAAPASTPSVQAQQTLQEASAPEEQGVSSSPEEPESGISTEKSQSSLVELPAPDSPLLEEGEIINDDEEAAEMVAANAAAAATDKAAATATPAATPEPAPNPDGAQQDITANFSSSNARPPPPLSLERLISTILFPFISNPMNTRNNTHPQSAPIPPRQSMLQGGAAEPALQPRQVHAEWNVQPEKGESGIAEPEKMKITKSTSDVIDQPDSTDYAIVEEGITGEDEYMETVAEASIENDAASSTSPAAVGTATTAHAISAAAATATPAATDAAAFNPDRAQQDSSANLPSSSSRSSHPPSQRPIQTIATPRTPNLMNARPSANLLVLRYLPEMMRRIGTPTYIRIDTDNMETGSMEPIYPIHLTDPMRLMDSTDPIYRRKDSLDTITPTDDLLGLMDHREDTDSDPTIMNREDNAILFFPHVHSAHPRPMIRYAVTSLSPTTLD